MPERGSGRKGSLTETQKRKGYRKIRSPFPSKELRSLGPTEYFLVRSSDRSVVWVNDVGRVGQPRAVCKLEQGAFDLERLQCSQHMKM